MHNGGLREISFVRVSDRNCNTGKSAGFNRKVPASGLPRCEVHISHKRGNTGEAAGDAP